ncbi:hypothetical protein [Rhodopirellula sp. P2]|uniref:hypothetical protein n=1 Tax=Rhodopirellula sp. P2 TaxID=2127060 RepID=UPI002368AE6D|nr:hypothetical protein [Rhodopirellula sp. P2]WDQ16360.1 hypothetical protein PSR62_22445 [Rhodopirellula sp. P2]
MSHWSIADQAEVETWAAIRSNGRSSLSHAATLSLLYLLAALAVGAFLLSAVAQICEGTVYYVGWDEEELLVAWMRNLMWVYAGGAAIALTGWLLVQLSLRGRLPSVLSAVVAKIPGVGRAIQTIALADFCESIYRSVVGSQTYGDAFRFAAQETRFTPLQNWAVHSALQLDAGQSWEHALSHPPIKDHPLAAVTALGQGQLSREETMRMWYQAASDSHSLIESRSQRSVRNLFRIGLIGAVLTAGFAILAANTAIVSMINGLTFFGWW